MAGCPAAAAAAEGSGAMMKEENADGEGADPGGKAGYYNRRYGNGRQSYYPYFGAGKMDGGESEGKGGNDYNNYNYNYNNGRYLAERGGDY